MAKVSVKWARGGGYNGEIRQLGRVRQDAMMDAGNWLAVQIERRTQDGKDEAGNRFRPYSARYAKEKNVPRNRVDLTRSGDMWATWGVLWAAINKVRIGFTSGAMEARARYNEEMGRRFLGMENRWLAEIRRRLAKGVRFDHQ